MVITDLETWLLDNEGKILRMWEYRRVGDWTPFEMNEKYSDQNNLVDDSCNFIIIKEAIELPDKDVLIGYISTSELPFIEEDSISITYKKLSMILLEYFPNDDKKQAEYDAEGEIVEW